jgi:hypothetical protein
MSTRTRLVFGTLAALTISFPEHLPSTHAPKWTRWRPSRRA